MADTFTTQQRSRVMASVRSRDTGPEIFVRRLLHRMGYRFRLHVPNLPGKPDIVLPCHLKAIFVHGCFWHGHKGCRRSVRPTTKVAFWNAKIDRNIDRDAAACKALRSMGWKVLVIWECRLRREDVLLKSLEKFLCIGHVEGSAPLTGPPRFIRHGVRQTASPSGPCVKTGTVKNEK